MPEVRRSDHDLSFLTFILSEGGRRLAVVLPFFPMQERNLRQQIRRYLSGKDGSAAFAAFAQTASATAGLPDIILCYKGWFVAVEVKTPRGKLSERQKYVRDHILEAGGLYLVVRSVKELDNGLREIDALVSSEGRN